MRCINTFLNFSRFSLETSIILWWGNIYLKFSNSFNWTSGFYFLLNSTKITYNKYTQYLLFKIDVRTNCKIKIDTMKSCHQDRIKRVKGISLFTQGLRSYLQHNPDEVMRKKQTTQWKNWAKYLNRYFTKQISQIISKYMERCSTSFIFREMQIKLKHTHTHTMSYYITPRIAKMKGGIQPINVKCKQSWGSLELSYTVCNGKLIWWSWKTV